MENILVSIIVPIYNVEKYITRCVDSLTKQDHSRIEIILVDDGTPDESGKIIDALAKNDDRIRVIHKENGGVSTARNAGLDIAKGDYVMFVDGDDYVDSDYVSYFLNLVISEDFDIAFNTLNYAIKCPNKIDTGHCQIVDALKAMEYIYLGSVNVAVWNKIYKRSFLENNGIRFDPDYWYGEGMLFNIVCLQYTDRVAVGENTVYYQVPNPESAMRKFNLESNYCGLRSMDRQKELWIKKNKDVENAWDFHRWCFNYSILLGITKSNMEKQYQQEYKKCIRNLRFHFMRVLRVNMGMRKKLVYVLIACCPVLMAKRGVRRGRTLMKRKKKEQRGCSEAPEHK